MNEIQNPILRFLLVIAGVICVGLGILGIFLPILPTTPFLLLAAVCFIRSSRKMYDWLLTNRLFGNHLKSYLMGKGISRKVKIGTISFLWITIVLSAFFVTDIYIVRLFLLMIALSVTVHIVLIKSTQ